MRIEIDFDNKTIEVKDSSTLGELVDKLKELKLEWKEFKLKVGVEYISYPWIYPWTNPWLPPWPTYIVTQPVIEDPNITPYIPPYHITCGASAGATDKILTEFLD